MKIRLGYVAISKSLDNVTSSHALNYTNYEKNKDINKIYEVINRNLTDLDKILNYNIKNSIHFYRLTSHLIPLADHKDVNFDYVNKFSNEFLQLSKLINDNHMRVDLHPNQFAVLNSTKKEVVENTFRILEYQYNLLKSLNIKNKIIILHIGSNTFGKKQSIARFIKNFNLLPTHIKKCIAIENDDKIFNILDALEISKKLNIPIVLDYHHHICNNDNINIRNYYERIFNSWKTINPKVHFSSPKNKTKKDIRSHHDYINVDDFITFIEEIKYLNYDVDIMVEAKEKDEAMFRLIRNLKYKTNYKFIDDTTFEVN